MKLIYRKTTIGILAAGTAIMMFLMFLSGRPLNTPETPGGILSLEFANTAQKIQNILAAWKNNSAGETDIIAAAKNNTCLDFIFLFFYSFLLFTCCRQLAASLPGKKRFSLFFNFLSFLALLAGLLDVAENRGMLRSLNGEISDKGAGLTATFAAVKWIIVLGVILFIAGGLVYRRHVKRAGV